MQQESYSNRKIFSFYQWTANKDKVLIFFFCNFAMSEKFTLEVLSEQEVYSSQLDTQNIVKSVL